VCIRGLKEKKKGAWEVMGKGWTQSSRNADEGGKVVLVRTLLGEALRRGGEGGGKGKAEGGEKGKKKRGGRGKKGRKKRRGEGGDAEEERGSGGGGEGRRSSREGRGGKKREILCCSYTDVNLKRGKSWAPEVKVLRVVEEGAADQKIRGERKGRRSQVGGTEQLMSRVMVLRELVVAGGGKQKGSR